MAVPALASLLERIELISSSPIELRSSLLGNINLNRLKERVSLLLNNFKQFDAKSKNKKIKMSEKENIRVMASELDYSLQGASVADLTRKKIHKMLQAIAEEIDSMNSPTWGISSFDPSEEIEQTRYISSIEDGILSSDDAAYSYKLLSVGLEESLKQLRQELTGSSSKLEMVGIVGMAGIGKTTLANMIYRDHFVIQHFDLQAWVRISQSHTKRDILLQVLKCINKERSYDIHGETEASLEEDLCTSLKNQRYLIVVDDLWSVKAWNEMKMPYLDDYMGSRILFTSQQSGVIEDLKCTRLYHMSLLDEHDSWELMQKKVFGQDTCPPSLVDTGKQIAKNCRGLPLAIVVMAGVLLKIKKNTESWQVIADVISSLVPSSTNPCQEMFALSYKHLPAHLKSCFLYMGAFPGGGVEIECQELVRLWIAEGFIIPRDSGNLEQVADGYLKDLIDRSLVLSASKKSNGNVKTCYLHDLVLEFCIKQSRQNKFLDVIKDFREEKDLGGEEDIDDVPRENLSTEKDHRLCRFSFQCNTFKDISPKSQACTAIFTVCSHEVPDILFYALEFKLLVVLDMIPFRFDSFPEEQVSKLLFLKYLALTTSFDLPSVVFTLLKLQTLIVNDSRLHKTTAPALPVEFWGSMNLRHMQLQVANHLPPPDDELLVKQMESLLTLSKVTLSSCFTRETFARIPNVTKLGVCETMKCSEDDFQWNWNIFFENLVLLSHLEILKVYCSMENPYNERVLPMPNPNAFPESLRKLTLSYSYLPWEKMNILSELPNLEALKLINYAFQGPKWEAKGGGFHRLSYLLIEDTDLTNWSLKCDDCFPRLQKLVLKCCNVLEEIPEQIGDIPTLSCMELCYCSNTAEQSAKYIQEVQEEYDHNIEVLIRRKIIKD